MEFSVLLNIEHYFLQFLHHPGVDPFIAPTQRKVVAEDDSSDILSVGAAETEYLHEESVENQPVGHPWRWQSSG